jgi:acyl-CoA synthetase (AMP-forming)/AMP-acid ligase II
MRPLPDGSVGEIWVASPSVTRGYWNRPEDTALTFGASIAGEPGARWLRTGDLGALRDGALFVAGRIKDVLIVHGVKYYPQDIEQAAESWHAGLRPGSSAAFGTTGADGRERIVLVAEVDLRRLEIPGMRAPDIRNVTPLPGAAVAALDLLARSVREVVLRELGLVLDAVGLAPAGTVPKTTSGKIRRSACAQAWAGDSLELLAEHPARERAWDDDRSLRTGT